MATVYSTLDPNHVLTEKELAELEEMENSPIVYDEDCPFMTYDEMLAAIEYTKKHKFLEKRGG